MTWVMTRFPVFLSWGLGLGVALAARSAAAVPPDGAVQVSLDGSLISYTLTRVHPDRLSAFDSAPSESFDESLTQYGPFDSGFGLGAGYVLGRFVLGARAQLASSTFSNEGSVGDAGRATGDTKQTDVSFFPRAEVMFDGSEVRAFAALLLGIEHSTYTPPANQLKTLATSYLAGASLGVHAFLSDRLSVDPALTALGFAGSQWVRSNDEVDGVNPIEDNSSTTGYRLMLSVGLSAWIGGGKN